MLKFDPVSKEIFKDVHNPLIISDYDMKMYDALLSLVNKHRVSYSTILKSTKCSELWSWVKDKTPLLDDEAFTYQVSTRVIWVLEGRTSFPKCLNPFCTKDSFGQHKNLTLRDLRDRIGYLDYCSTRCMNMSPFVKEHRRQTNLERIGVENPFQSDSCKEKSKKTCMTRFGVEHPSQNTDVKARTISSRKKHFKDDPQAIERFETSCKETNLKNGHPEKWTNTEKAKETNLKIRGVEWPSQDPKVISKRQKNNLKKHGVKETLQLPGVHEKSQEAIVKKYGVTAVSKLPEVKLKTQSTNLKRYGAKSPLEAESIKNKILNTWKTKYGVKIPSQSPQVKSKIMKTRIDHFGSAAIPSKRYIYDDQSFDSSWELCLWIFCKDNGISIKRSTKSFAYAYSGGKTSTYSVDFEIDGNLVEVKGDQFFKEDGTMTLPFRNPSWSDEKYEEMCSQYEAKHQCMKNNGIVIMTYKDIKPCISYVIKQYGKHYLDQFKMPKSRKPSNN